MVTWKAGLSLLVQSESPSVQPIVKLPAATGTKVTADSGAEQAVAMARRATTAMHCRACVSNGMRIFPKKRLHADQSPGQYDQNVRHEKDPGLGQHSQD